MYYVVLLYLGTDLVPGTVTSCVFGGGGRRDSSFHTTTTTESAAAAALPVLYNTKVVPGTRYQLLSLISVAKTYNIILGIYILSMLLGHS